MRKRLLGAVGVLLVSAGFAFAEPVPTEAPADDPYQPTQAASAYPAFMWANADYLLWRIKGGRQLPPLVTTGPAAANNPAVLTDPATVVIYPHDSVDYDGFSGGRITAGFWFNSCESLGFEASGFLTESAQTHSKSGRTAAEIQYSAHRSLTRRAARKTSVSHRFRADSPAASP